MKIVCIGDSITYGFGIRRSETWISLAAEKTGLKIQNKGINGDTTGGMLARFKEDVINTKPKIVLIMGGANDLIAGADLGIVKANIMAMCHQAFGSLITPVVGISPPMDTRNIRDDWRSFADFSKINTEMTLYREWIYQFSKTFNVQTIDFYSEINKKTTDFTGSLYIDGLHLNEAGQSFMAEAFCDFIIKYITE